MSHFTDIIWPTTDIIWPTLEKPTLGELAAEETSQRVDITAVREEGWVKNAKLALEEARRLADAEEDRRRSTENKASTYLLFASAFAAALIPFLPGILEGKTGSAPRLLIAIILIIAVLYLVAAGIWAFRTLRVGTYHRLDVAELIRIWRDDNPERALIRETFATGRMNYRAVNDKVSCIKMAHQFMVRSFVVFGILLVVEAGWEAAHSVIEPHVGPVAIDSKESPKLDKSGATETTPHRLGSGGADLPGSGQKPQSGAPAGENKLDTDSSQPAANVKPTDMETKVPVIPEVNGSTSPDKDAPGK
jgi:hypothetical protein